MFGYIEFLNFTTAEIYLFNHAVYGNEGEFHCGKKGTKKVNLAKSDS